jgi:hypothetical protein
MDEENGDADVLDALSVIRKRIARAQFFAEASDRISLQNGAICWNDPGDFAGAAVRLVPVEGPAVTRCFERTSVKAHVPAMEIGIMISGTTNVGGAAC